MIGGPHPSLVHNPPPLAETPELPWRCCEPEPTQQMFSISAVIMHPDYQPMTHANDICLLQVSFVDGGNGHRSGLSPPHP